MKEEGVNDGGENELSRKDWERVREPGRVQHANNRGSGEIIKWLMHN